MSSTSLAKESRIGSSLARLEQAVSRLDAALASGLPSGAASEETTAEVSKLTQENTTLRDLNREAADRLADAIEKLESIAGKGNGD